MVKLQSAFASKYLTDNRLVELENGNIEEHYEKAVDDLYQHYIQGVIKQIEEARKAAQYSIEVYTDAQNHEKPLDFGLCRISPSLYFVYHYMINNVNENDRWFSRWNPIRDAFTKVTLELQRGGYSMKYDRYVRYKFVLSWKDPKLPRTFFTSLCIIASWVARMKRKYYMPGGKGFKRARDEFHENDTKRQKK